MTEPKYTERTFDSAIGVGKIKYNPDKGHLYKGTMPFEDGEEVYVIRRDAFAEMVRNGLSMLQERGIEMPQNLSDLFPDEVFFNLVREDSDDSTRARLFLDRHFYSHNVGSYVYVRFASISEYERTGDFNRQCDYSEGDPIEDVVLERDNVERFRSELEETLGDTPTLHTLHRRENGSVYWSDGIDEYEIEETEEEPFNPIEGLPDIDDWLEDDDDEIN